MDAGWDWNPSAPSARSALSASALGRYDELSVSALGTREELYALGRLTLGRASDLGVQLLIGASGRLPAPLALGPESTIAREASACGFVDGQPPDGTRQLIDRV